MAYQYFRHPISWLEQSIRKFYCYTMRWLGYPNFVVRAQGVFFLVGLTDMIDRSIAIFGIWESDQVDHLAHVCDSQKADYFFDIGANAGVYSILFTLKGLVPEAVAFEPDPGNYAHLLSNIYINNLTEKIKAFPLAVGDRSGEVDLMQADVFNRGESWIAHPDKPPEEAVGVATHCVKQIRLDDEFSLSNKTLVMKIDVEGSEFHALRGMERTLRNNLCYLQVELYSDRFEELKALFAELGYRYLKTSHIDHYFTNILNLK